MIARLTGLVEHVLPRTRHARVLTWAAAVDSVGTGLFLAGGIIYFVQFVGLDPVAVGAGVALANVCGLISPLPVGWVVDRVGVTRVYVALLVLRAIGYSAYALAGDLTAYLVMTCALTAFDRACSPLLQVVVGEYESDEDRTRTMACIRAMRNVGLTAGVLAAGLVMAWESKAAMVALFVGNSVSFLVIAQALRTVAKAGSARVARAAAERPDRPRSAGPYRDARFLAVSAANVLLSLHDSVLFVLLPLWVVAQPGMPLSTASILLAVNTVLTILIQVYVARFGRGVRAAVRLTHVAALLLIASCALFPVAESLPTGAAITVAVVAVLVLSVGENLHSVSSWELSYEMSPPPARSQYLALFSMGATAQMIVGPVLMTLVLAFGALGWAVLGGLFAVASAVTALAARAHPDASG